MDANQNRTRQKTGKLTDCTRNGGVVSFGYFSLDKQRKVSRPSGTKNNILKNEIPLVRGMTRTKEKPTALI